VSVGDLMRDLDRRVLPPLARALGRLGEGPAPLRLLTPVALLSVCAVVVTAVWAADRAPLRDEAAPDVVRVGVVEGQTVGGYVGASRSELAALADDPTPGVATAPVYALATLVTYFAPERVAPVLAGVPVVQVYARAQLTDLPTQVVRLPVQRLPRDVVVGLLDAAKLRDQETADHLQQRAAVVGDGPAERRLRLQYENAARAATGEATAYRAGCSCVYAAVVRATPAALERLAARPEVRAVDPAPEVRRLDHAEFRPPLPEQVPTDAPTPATIPATSPGSAPAPTRPESPEPTVAPTPDQSAIVTPDPVTSTSAESSVTPSSSTDRTTDAPTGVPSSEPTSAGGTASP
jgi:hypothetical protein